MNGVNPDGVVRGSGIFAKGWGADRARTYGIPEDKLGEFYAQRTLLKREVLPEHVAAAVFALTGRRPQPDDRSPHPRRRGCRGGVPAVTGRLVAAVDLGASSGRVMVGRVGPNELELTEVHRFPNEPVRLPDGLHWDILRPLPRGPRRSARGEPGPPTAWSASGSTRGAIDYGLLDEAGALLGDPYHYRDERTAAAVDAVHEVIPPADLYARTGLQFLPFNTIYQLAAARGTRGVRGRPDDAAHPGPARLLARRASASPRSRTPRRPACSTSTGGPGTSSSSTSLGIPPSLFAPLGAPGDVIGPAAGRRSSPRPALRARRC